MNDQVIRSLERLHNKIDSQSIEITNLRVTVAPLGVRLGIIEKIVYAGTGMVLLAVAAAVIGVAVPTKRVKNVPVSSQDMISIGLDQCHKPAYQSVEITGNARRYQCSDNYGGNTKDDYASGPGS